MKRLLRKRNKGFTLIELMIVVAIIGILAAIAIPNFLRFQLRSKSSEGKVNVAAIRSAEVAYNSEYGTFVPAAESPAGPPIGQKRTFVDTQAAVAGAGFGVIGWEPEGMVYFDYIATTENPPGTASQNLSLSAQADIDADTTMQWWGYIRTGTAVQPSGGCVATGVYNAVTGNIDVMDTVGPCNANSGKSIF